MTDRKPLVLLGVLAILAIAVFVVGAAGGGRDTVAWPEWAAPQRSLGDPLIRADLRGSPACDFGGTTITFTGVCRVEVREVTGGWPWESATRRALLTAIGQPVELSVTLMGRQLRTGLDPGDRIRLTYTREGGSFVLGCGVPTGCVVALTEDS